MSHVRHRHPLIITILVLVIAAVAMSACGNSPSDENGGGEPARVEPLNGTDLNSVTLTKQAAERLGIRTAKVRQRGAQRTVVPYGAVLYSADGSTFTYTSPKPLVYVRAPINVDRINGAEAILLTGPPVGTDVVTVGSQELYGSEYAVEED
jgi:hypothetical protein